MPDEALDQGQTIDDLILDILADEAQIIRCLRVFFCDTLQELSEKYAHCPELKIRLADNLITAAAKKEEALAKVLEAISLFDITDDFTPLLPGENYPWPPGTLTISKITCEAKTAPGTTSELSVTVFGSPSGSYPVSETLITLEWDLVASYPVESVLLTNTGSSTIYIRNLTTE